MSKLNSINTNNESNYSDDEEEQQQETKQTKILSGLNMNEIASANANKTLANYYEQMVLQRNLEMYQKQINFQQQQQQQELQLQIQPNFSLNTTNASNSNKTNESCSSSTSTSSLLSISSSSSKSQQVSPSSSPVLPKTYDQLDQSAKYRAYMMNMAAAAAFPYSMFGFPPGAAAAAVNAQAIQQQQHQSQMAACVAAAAAAAASNSNSYLNHANQNRNILFENFPGLFAAAAASQQSQTNTQYNHQINSSHNSHNNMNSNSHSESSHYSNTNTNANTNNRVVMKQEEPKPAHSYIGLIALAILSTPEKKLVLSDIYQWILDNYSYFHTRGSGWRNSIRHNLSLNDCFMKSGRSANGKGHYWTIHPANLEDFSRGDFRRRRAQRRVRKSLGLTLPEEDEEDEDDDILTPPSSLSPVPNKNLINPNFTLNIPHNNANLAMKRQLHDNEHENRKKIMKPNETNENQMNHFLQPSVLNAANFHQQIINYANNFSNNNNNNTSNSSLVEDSSYENDTSNDNQSESNDTDHNSYLQSNNETTNHKQSSQNSNNNSTAKKRSFNVDSLLAPDQNSTNLEEENEESDDNDENNNNKRSKRLKTSEDDEDEDARVKSNESLNDSYDDLEQKRRETYSSKKMIELNQKNKLKSQRIDLTRGSNHHHQSQQQQSQLRHSSHSRTSLHLSTDQHQNSPFSKLESNNVDVEKWKQTFSKIMARSYKNNNNNNQFNSSNLVDAFSPNKK